MCVRYLTDMCYVLYLLTLCFLMQVTNYELGVVFPLKDYDHIDRIACWERPPRKYVLGDDVPWVRFIITLVQIVTQQDIDATRRCKTIPRFLNNSGRSHSNLCVSGSSFHERPSPRRSDE